MSTLGPLLEVQELDSQADRLRKQRATLPERGALVLSQAAIAAIDLENASAQAELDGLARLEREVSGEVAVIASKAQEIDSTLYSGTVTVPKELGALQQELDIYKRKQEEAEERELELLEQIELADAGLSGERERRAKAEAASADLTAKIAAAEIAIDAEIAGLENAAIGIRSALPAPVLATYDRLRSNSRLAGRAVVPLASQMCGGCRVDLPVMEYRRVRDEPEDALVCCIHCSRLLVR